MHKTSHSLTPYSIPDIFFPGWSSDDRHSRLKRSFTSYRLFPSYRAWKRSFLRRFPGGISVRYTAGWSLGGQVLLRAIADGCIKTKALLLIATPYAFIDPFFTAASKKACKSFANAYRYDPERILRSFFHRMISGDAQAKRLAPLMMQNISCSRYDYHWITRELFPFNARILRIPREYTPHIIHIIHGRNDKIVSYKQATTWKNIFPHGKITYIPRCGHAPHLSHPEITFYLEKFNSCC